MKHIQPVTAMPRPAQGVTTPVEGAILLLITIFFQDWDNFQQVLRNLQKFYSKTP
jgi:hypothetical protein